MQLRGQSWRRDGKRLESPQRLPELRLQDGEIPADGSLPADEYIILVGTRAVRDHQTRHFAQTPADPVADDGIADLAADGEADPDGRKVEAGRKGGDLQDEAGHGTSPPGLDAQEVATVRQTPEARRRQKN